MEVRIDQNHLAFVRSYGKLSVADPDTRLGATSCGRSNYSAKGDNLICFLLSYVYFFVGGGQGLKPKWMGAMAGFTPFGSSQVNSFIAPQRNS